MNILNLEEAAFEKMMAAFDALSNKIEQVCKDANKNGLQKWLTNGEVCVILNLEKRQLQHYRDSGKISYSKIGKVIYYRPEDVMNLINKVA